MLGKCHKFAAVKLTLAYELLDSEMVVPHLSCFLFTCFSLGFFESDHSHILIVNPVMK